MSNHSLPHDNAPTLQDPNGSVATARMGTPSDGGQLGERGVSAERTTQDKALEAERLVHAAQSGQRGAFDELVRTYRPRVYALALHITGSASDADDVTQDTFVRAYRNLATFEGRSHFFTWLYRIALHRALSVARARKRSRVHFDDDRVRAALAVDATDDPRSQLELRESYAMLLHALDALSPSLRTTVVLIVLQGLSYREAAQVLSAEEGTIAWRMHEARHKLREHLAKQERARAGRELPSAASCYELLQRLLRLSPA